MSGKENVVNKPFFWSETHVDTDDRKNVVVGWYNRDGDDYLLNEMDKIEAMFEAGEIDCVYRRDTDGKLAMKENDLCFHSYGSIVCKYPILNKNLKIRDKLIGYLISLGYVSKDVKPCPVKLRCGTETLEVIHNDEEESYILRYELSDDIVVEYNEALEIFKGLSEKNSYDAKGLNISIENNVITMEGGYLSYRHGLVRQVDLFLYFLAQGITPEAITYAELMTHESNSHYYSTKFVSSRFDFDKSRFCNKKYEYKNITVKNGLNKFWDEEKDEDAEEYYAIDVQHGLTDSWHHNEIVMRSIMGLFFTCINKQFGDDAVSISYDVFLKSDTRIIVIIEKNLRGNVVKKLMDILLCAVDLYLYDSAVPSTCAVLFNETALRIFDRYKDGHSFYCDYMKEFGKKF